MKISTLLSVSLVVPVGLLATDCLADMVETVTSSPVATGGDYIRRIAIDDHNWSYVHVFTNASVAMSFASKADWPLDVRYLVVGGGGAGGIGSSNYGGGGGGGGGVLEEKGVSFPAGTSWTIQVGAGSSAELTQAGGSSISNGVSEICAVPGGGSGGSLSDAAAVGAAGGGGAYQGTGAVGSFASQVLGMLPPTGGYAGGAPRDFAGGGGGGAGAAGGKAWWNVNVLVGGSGGEGLSSDITGESFVYGSGGGGGSLNGASNFGPGGAGGTNAGSGGGRGDDASITQPATAPVANSGAGGGGGSGNKITDATMGADGIVVIRYDYSSVDQGLILIFR